MTAALSRRTAAGLAFLAGLAAFLLLHLLFRLCWDSLFALAPWPGYEESMRRGLVEPWFVHTPRSLWLTRVVFFALALGIALARTHARWSTALGLWLGAAAGIVFTYATTSVRTLEWGWLGFVLYPFRVVLPILLGTGLGELARRTLLKPRRA